MCEGRRRGGGVREHYRGANGPYLPHHCDQQSIQSSASTGDFELSTIQPDSKKIVVTTTRYNQTDPLLTDFIDDLVE